MELGLPLSIVFSSHIEFRFPYGSPGRCLLRCQSLGISRGHPGEETRGNGIPKSPSKCVFSFFTLHIAVVYNQVGDEDELHFRGWDKRQLQVVAVEEWNPDRLQPVCSEPIILVGVAALNLYGRLQLVSEESGKSWLLAGKINRSFFAQNQPLLFAPNALVDNQLYLDYPPLVFHDLFLSAKQYEINPPLSLQSVQNLLRENHLQTRDCKDRSLRSD